MVKISVIIPVYNVEEYLHRCVDSLLSQSFKNFDIILINDGSKDNSGKICEFYAKEYSFINVVHQENQGLSQARNTGIEWAKENSCSQWISFIDSDDWVHPQYLEFLYHGIVKEQVDICVCNYGKVKSIESFNTEKLECLLKVQTSKEYFLEKDINIVAWGKLYNKALFSDIRYPIGKIHEDEYVTYKILFMVEKIVVIDQPLYAYFQRENSIMNSQWSINRLDKLSALDAQLEFFNEMGDEALCLNVADKSIRMLSYSIKKLANVKSEYARLVGLSRSLRSLLKQYGTQLKITPISNVETYLLTIPKYVVISYLIKKKKNSFFEVYSENGVRGVISKVVEKRNRRNYK